MKCRDFFTIVVIFSPHYLSGYDLDSSPINVLKIFELFIPIDNTSIHLIFFFW